MNNHSWQDVALAAIAIIPGCVAAVVAAWSSLKNGKKLDTLHKKKEWPELNVNLWPDDGNTASNPDWYKAPTLWSK